MKKKSTICFGKGEECTKYFPNKSWVYLLIIFMMLSKLNAQVEDKELFDLSLEELLNIEVVTASQKDQKISDAPATVISYSAEQIKMFGWKDLKDIFKTLPGFDVSNDNQGEIRTGVTLRGIVGNSKILVLQDGQRYNPTTGERVIYSHNTPLSIYKRIEIVYGPASALYGADAYSGVINLITYDGADIDGIKIKAGYNTTQAYIGDFIFGKKVSEDVDVIINARVYNGKDADLTKDYPEYKNAVDSYKGELGSYSKDFPIKNWNLLTKIKYGKFTIGADWQHEYETAAPTEIPYQYAYIKNNVWGQDIRHAYVNYETEVTKDYEVDATISVGDYEINPATNFFVITNTDLSSGSPAYKYGYSSYVKGNLLNNYKVSDNLSFIGGLSFEKVKSFPKTKNLTGGPFQLNGELQDDLSYFVDPNGYTYGLLNIKESTFGERNYNNFGMFLQGEWLPIENLSITAGARYDYNTIYKGTTNPRIGLVYKPLEKTSIKLLYGSAYIAPSNYYRWENWANPYAMHIPNLDIKPEKLQNFSVSLTQYLGTNTSVRIEGFYNKLTDVIVPVPAPKQAGNYPYYNPLAISGDPFKSYLEDPTGYFVEINANQGNITTKGLEFQVNQKYQNFLLDLSYSYCVGDDGGYDLPKVSPHKIVLNASYLYSDFSIAVTGRYYSDVRTAITNSEYKGGTFDGAFILYLNANYNLSKEISLTLSIDNLLNKKHYGAAPYGEGVWITSRAPQALRTVYFGINTNF
jgi:iron complex outermembrane receptor protein